MQSDPAAWLSEPFAHELGMMIARVVEKDMDQHEHRIERLDRLQETDRRGGVDCQRLDHPGLAGLQIDRTVNVDALTPARLFDRELLLAWRPAARWPRGMGWMHCVNEQHSFFVRQGIQEIIVALDERLLLLYVELARDHVRLVILEPQTMQKRDQPRAAFINEAKFLLDPGTDLACRTRQRRAYPRLQIVLLLHTQIAGAPAHIEAGDALDPVLLEKLAPAADRVIVKKKRIGDFLTAPPVMQKHQGVGAARHATGHRPIARQHDQLAAIFFAEEATSSNHARNRIRHIYLSFNRVRRLLRCVLELWQHFEPFLGAAREHHFFFGELQRTVRDDNQVSAHAQEATDREHGIWLLAVGAHEEVVNLTDGFVGIVDDASTNDFGRAIAADSSCTSTLASST